MVTMTVCKAQKYLFMRTASCCSEYDNRYGLHAKLASVYTRGTGEHSRSEV